MKRLRCGLIGYGRLGSWHARNIVRNQRAELVGVAEPVAEAREKIKRDLGLENIQENYQALLDDKSIDAIVLASPTKYHYKILSDIIDSGKSIFVEKPITYTVEEAEDICERVERAKLYLQVGYMRRFDPGHVAAKKMIDAGEIGDPIYIHDCQRDPNGPPKAYVPESGGIFVDMGIHDLDVARWIMSSEVETIFAQGAVLKHKYLTDMGDVDDGQMLLRFKSGALGSLEVSRNANDIYDVRTEIVGTKSSVYIGQVQHTPFVKVGASGFTYDQANWCLGRFEKAYELEMEAFVGSVLDGKESPVTPFDGLMGLKLAVRATESNKKGVTVRV